MNDSNYRTFYLEDRYEFTLSRDRDSWGTVWFADRLEYGKDAADSVEEFKRGGNASYGYHFFSNEFASLRKQVDALHDRSRHNEHLILYEKVTFLGTPGVVYAHTSRQGSSYIKFILEWYSDPWDEWGQQHHIMLSVPSWVRLVHELEEFYATQLQPPA